MSQLRRPCENCPWRRDAPVGFWDWSHFESIYKNCRDTGFHIMSCHKGMDMPANEQPVCQGWVRVVGYDAIGVRLALRLGRITVEELEDKEGPELYSTFEEMMEANRGKSFPKDTRSIRAAKKIIRRGRKKRAKRED